MNATIIQLTGAPGRRCIWSSQDPFTDIVSIEHGAVSRLSEVRCVAIGEVGTLRVVRAPDNSARLEHPASMIVGYVRDGVRHGDQRLWEDITW